MLGATNRPEILDAALLRPGRFDRRVAVQPPDRAGRRRILDVHTRALPLAEDVDLDVLAASTPAWSAPTWRTSPTRPRCSPPAVVTTRSTMVDFTGSLDKIVLGAPRGIVLLPRDRERTAYHESGHALVGMFTPDADPVRQVTIIPRGMALGVTLSTPDVDRVSYTREELEAQIKVALGGASPRRSCTAPSPRARVRHRAAQPHRTAHGRALGLSERLGPIAWLPRR